MTTSSWLPKINEILTEVSRSLSSTYSGFDLSTSQAFDGGGWVWTWRRYYEELTGGGNARVAEVQFRVRPDQIREGPQAELLAAAWGFRERRVSWSRICWARYVDPNELHDKRFAAELTTALVQAWADAQLATESLTAARDHRADALARLKGTGVRVRAHHVSSDDAPQVSPAPVPLDAAGRP